MGSIQSKPGQLCVEGVVGCKRMREVDVGVAQLALNPQHLGTAGLL